MKLFSNYLQTEEVLEFVVQYEKEFKLLKDFLSSHASNVEAIKKKIEDQPEESWQELSEVRKFKSSSSFLISLVLRQ